MKTLKFRHTKGRVCMTITDLFTKWKFNKSFFAKKLGLTPIRFNNRLSEDNKDEFNLSHRKTLIYEMQLLKEDLEATIKNELKVVEEIEKEKG